MCIWVMDIIVYKNGFDQFCERLEILFQRLENKNISLKAAKLKLNVQIIEYVGRQISKEGITMSSKKIRGVTNFPMPRKTIVSRTHQTYSGSCTKSLQRGSTTA